MYHIILFFFINVSYNITNEIYADIVNFISKALTGA